jgi:hypothetical protein
MTVRDQRELAVQELLEKWALLAQDHLVRPRLEVNPFTNRTRHEPTQMALARPVRHATLPPVGRAMDSLPALQRAEVASVAVGYQE